MKTITTFPGHAGRAFSLGVMAILALFSVSPVAWSQVGYVHEMSGTVNVIRTPGAAPTPTRPGDTFQPGATFDTGKDGKVVIKFQDGQLAALQENSTFRIDRYNFNQKDVQSSSAAFSFLKGAMRFVTGVIGATNPGATRLTAGTATIGIRGTDITILVDANTQAMSAASVVSGSIAVQTALGTTTVTQGQFASAALNAAPSAAAPMNAAPAAVQALLNLAAATSLPINLPILVGQAAAASAGVAAARVAQLAAATAARNAAAVAADANATAAQRADASANAARLSATAASALATATNLQNIAIGTAVQAFAAAVAGNAVAPRLVAAPAGSAAAQAVAQLGGAPNTITTLTAALVAAQTAGTDAAARAAAASTAASAAATAARTAATQSL